MKNQRPFAINARSPEEATGKCSHGKGTEVLLDEFDLSSYFNSVDTSRSTDTAETTAFGSSSKSYIVGLRDATISVSGIWDATVDGYFIGTEPASRTFIYGPAGDTGGNVKYTGEAILTSFSISNPVGDVVTYSADFQVTGDVTRTTF